MSSKTFVDTSGFYALFVRKDNMHERARNAVETAGRHGELFVTSDYVLDETATLLKSRALAHLLPVLFKTVMESSVCTLEWMDPERFAQTQSLFLKDSDHQWSFTDCFSFILMRELKSPQALSKDEHFREAGFTPLLV